MSLLASFLFKFNFIEIQLIYNAVLISAEQPRGAATRIHISIPI